MKRLTFLLALALLTTACNMPLSPSGEHAPATLVVSVVDPQNRPMANVAMYVERPNRPGERTYHLTLPNGTVTFAYVVAGTSRVEVIPPYLYLPPEDGAIRTLQIAPGEFRKVTFSLRRE